MSDNENEPATLAYERHVVTRPVVESRHGRWATMLMLLATLLGGACVLSVFFADRLGNAGWLLIASGVLLIYVTLGCLSSQRLKYRTALSASVVITAVSAVAFFLIQRDTSLLEAKLVAGKAGTVVVYIETEEGGRLATLHLARILAAAAVTVGAFLSLYVVTRLLRIRRAVCTGARSEGE